jgi:hypothetical protein
MSMDTLVALCDILPCTPNDLIKPEVVNTQLRKAVGNAHDPDHSAASHRSPSRDAVNQKQRNRRDLAEARARIVGHVRRRVPELTEQAAQAVLERATAWGPIPAQELARFAQDSWTIYLAA